MHSIKTKRCKQDLAYIYKLLVVYINLNVNHGNEQFAAAKYNEEKLVIYCYTTP